LRASCKTSAGKNQFQGGAGAVPVTRKSDLAFLQKELPPLGG